MKKFLSMYLEADYVGSFNPLHIDGSGYGHKLSLGRRRPFGQGLGGLC